MSEQESLHRTALRDDDSTNSAALTGAYVTPMPPQLRNTIGSSSSQSATAEQSSSCEVQQSSNMRNGSDGNAVPQAPDSTWDGEQEDASWQGHEPAQATAVQAWKTRGNNQTRRWNTSQKSAIAGIERWNSNAV